VDWQEETQCKEKKHSNKKATKKDGLEVCESFWIEFEQDHRQKNLKTYLRRGKVYNDSFYNYTYEY